MVMLTQTEQKPPDGQIECPRVRCFSLLPKAALLRRQEYATSLGGHKTSLFCFWVIHKGLVPVGKLILDMEKNGIGTAGSTASVLDELTTKEKPLLRVALQDKNRCKPLSISLTEKGKQQLELWRQHGLIGFRGKATAVINQVADGLLWSGEALNVLIGENKPAMDAAERYIENECLKWKGLSREEGLTALKKGQTLPPRIEGLPMWLDPEINLPADHPLRDIRRRMEEDLVIKFGDWITMSDEKRGLARLEWLKGHQAEYAGILPALEGYMIRYNTLVYWLTGLKLNS